MKKEITERLISKHPNVLKNITRLECGDGWEFLLDHLCGIIEHEMKSNISPLINLEIYANQIKSKFGGLRCYMNQETPFISGAIALAEYMSTRICEVCGSMGSQRTVNNWVSTLCDLHHKDINV